MPYYFYLARCADNTLYAGSCKDTAERETKHNSGNGAKYTRSRRPVRIVYREEFDSLSQALKREAEVKKLSREKKEELLQQN